VPTYLTPDQLARDLALCERTAPDSRPDAIQLLVNLVADALSHAWGCIQRRSSGPRIVAIADNYDNLGSTADAASRDRRYSRYVDKHRMFRSHASAMIPNALRALAADPVDEVLLVWVVSGPVLRELTLDPTKLYHPTGRPPGPAPK
jgi:phenylalanyl-tRNA synthetase alpha chain